MFDGISGFDGLNGRQLKLSTPNEAFLAGGEGQGSAVEGEGSPSDEQTEDPTGQSRRDGGVEVKFNSYLGDHEWQVWRKSLHEFAQYLFR